MLYSDKETGMARVISLFNDVTNGIEATWYFFAAVLEAVAQWETD